jgi:acyl-CoA thioester hydrolase
LEVHRCTVRVRYADTDAMGVVYNAAYLVWFEIGRTEWLRETGTPYSAIERRGVSLPVTDANLRFRAGGRYDDLVTVETILQEVRSRRVVFGYRILVGEKLLAEGSTVHVPVENKTGRSVRLPAWLAEHLAAAAPRP